MSFIKRRRTRLFKKQRQLSDSGHRSFLKMTALGGAGLALSLPRSVLADDPPPHEIVKMPGKTDLILLTDRPPQLETPLHYFRTDLTPNEAFYVRWHLAGLRTNINPKPFSLNVTGHVNTALKLSLKQLREDFEPAAVVAVNQCSGNSRSFFEPRIPGSQWGNGAMEGLENVIVEQRDFLAHGCGRPAQSVDYAIPFNILHLETPVELQSVPRDLTFIVVYFADETALQIVLIKSPRHAGHDVNVIAMRAPGFDAQREIFVDAITMATSELR